MPSSHPSHNLAAQKKFLQKAIPVLRICQDAFNRIDWHTLQHQANLLHLAAAEADHVILDVQAQLLEQSAEKRDRKRAGELLVRLKNNVTTILAEVRAGNLVKPQPPVTAAPGESPCKRLGNYLVEAELLTPAQIEVALADQKATGARLGEILAARGWIKQGTIEFIMQKVILPDREKQTSPGNNDHTSPDRPRPISFREFAYAHEEADSRETLVDPSQSTFIY